MAEIKRFEPVKVKMLIAEMDNANASFLHNEETGERRVEFFIGLVTAVIAALAVAWFETIKPSDAVDKQSVAIGSIGALLILFGFGVITFLRIVKRDLVTEEYKHISSYRRTQLGLDDPFHVVSKVNDEKGVTKKFLGGGLNYVVAYINCVIVFIIFVLYLPASHAPLEGGYGWIAFSISASLAAGTAQIFLSKKMRKGYQKKLKAAFDAELWARNVVVEEN